MGYQYPTDSHPFHSMSIVPPIPRIWFFKVWPWKPKVKVTAQGHIVGQISYRLQSLLFHVNWPSYSSNTVFSKSDLENSRSRSWKRSRFKATKCVPLPINLPFILCQSALLFLWYSFFNIWPWKSKVKVIQQHNYWFRQFHRTLCSVNPSCGFRDMCSTKSRPQWYLIW